MRWFWTAAMLGGLELTAVAMPTITVPSTEPPAAMGSSPIDVISSTTLPSGWNYEGAAIWSVKPATVGTSETLMLESLSLAGEQATGRLRSRPFRIEQPLMTFQIAGADGTTTSTNGGALNQVVLRAWPDGTVLRNQRPPGSHLLTPAQWVVADLIGREVTIEIVDGNPGLNPQGYAWIGLADIQQRPWPMLQRPVAAEHLHGLRIDGAGEQVYARTMPFLYCLPEQRPSARVQEADGSEVIAVEAEVEAIYLLGLINDGWDNGCAFWAQRPELWEQRPDQVYAGMQIGEVELRYAGGAIDRFPLTMGATAWFFQWWNGYTEPFASRPELAHRFAELTLFREDPGQRAAERRGQRYFLGVKPRRQLLKSIVIHDNPSVTGRPLISGVTVASKQPPPGSLSFGPMRVDAADLKPAFRAARPGNWARRLDALSDLLYMSDRDLPRTVKIVDWPTTLSAARLRFLGGPTADMLTNLWTVNLTQIAWHKINRETGFFRESQPGQPSYGGYTGVGTWTHVGQYQQWSFSRCADHFMTLALRCLDDGGGATAFVDFVDQHLYYYRDDHEPAHGPPNAALDVTRYPARRLPHWSFIINEPLAAVPTSVNEIAGNEEMDGTGATLVARWVAWRHLGRPTGDWLLGPRASIYGKSRWDATRDAADFIIWLMEYTERDVIYSEGECTGWGAEGRLPTGMADERLARRIRANYANADMFEVYPSTACMTALRCCAEMAEAAADPTRAARYRAAADEIERGMLRQLAVGAFGGRIWRHGPSSVFPTPHDSLAPAWFSMYQAGYDPVRQNAELVRISRNTLAALLRDRCKDQPVLGFGYGLGWMTQSALMLDELDVAGKALTDIARFSYDKNMDYADASRGIDWCRWAWTIPEGINLLPNGRWHRIGDLGNGANQGIVLHALETCAGIDDTQPDELRVMPRVPEPLTGLQVDDFPVLLDASAGAARGTPAAPAEQAALLRSKLSYRLDRERGHFELRCASAIPKLAVRLGPFTAKEAERVAGKGAWPSGAKVRIEQSGAYQRGTAWWIWVEELKKTETLSFNW